MARRKIGVRLLLYDPKLRPMAFQGNIILNLPYWRIGFGSAISGSHIKWPAIVHPSMVLHLRRRISWMLVSRDIIFNN